MKREIITIENFKDNRQLANAIESTSQAAMLSGVSETTIRRLRRSKNYAQYKELLRKDNPGRNQTEAPRLKRSFFGRLSGSLF